jgi:hypothetical protein
MKMLIAKKPVLYKARLYNSGEELPAGDERMTAAWLRAGTADWMLGADAPTEADDDDGSSGPQKTGSDDGDGSGGPQETEGDDGDGEDGPQETEGYDESPAHKGFGRKARR